MWIQQWKPLTWSGGEETDESWWHKHYRYQKWRQEFFVVFALDSFSWEEPKSPSPSSFTYPHAEFQDLRVIRSCNLKFSALGATPSYSDWCLTNNNFKKPFQYDIRVARQLLFYPVMPKCFIFLREKTASFEETSFSRGNFFVRSGLRGFPPALWFILLLIIIFKTEIHLYAQVLSELARQGSPWVSEQGH